MLLLIFSACQNYFDQHTIVIGALYGESQSSALYNRGEAVYHAEGACWLSADDGLSTPDRPATTAASRGIKLASSIIFYVALSAAASRFGIS